MLWLLVNSQNHISTIGWATVSREGHGNTAVSLLEIILKPHHPRQLSKCLHVDFLQSTKQDTIRTPYTITHYYTLLYIIVHCCTCCTCINSLCIYLCAHDKACKGRNWPVR